MRRMRWNRGSKWEPDWLRRCGGGQADQGEVLNDCCHVTSASGTLRSEGHVITILLIKISHKLKLDLINNIKKCRLKYIDFTKFSIKQK